MFYIIVSECTYMIKYARDIISYNKMIWRRTKKRAIKRMR